MHHRERRCRRILLAAPDLSLLIRPTSAERIYWPNCLPTAHMAHQRSHQIQSEKGASPARRKKPPNANRSTARHPWKRWLASARDTCRGRPGVAPDQAKGEICNLLGRPSINRLEPQIRDTFFRSDKGDGIAGGSPADGKFAHILVRLLLFSARKKRQNSRRAAAVDSNDLNPALAICRVRTLSSIHVLRWQGSPPWDRAVWDPRLASTPSAAPCRENNRLTICRPGKPRHFPASLLLLVVTGLASVPSAFMRQIFMSWENNIVAPSAVTDTSWEDPFKCVSCWRLLPSRSIRKSGFQLRNSCTKGVHQEATQVSHAFSSSCGPHQVPERWRSRFRCL